MRVRYNAKQHKNHWHVLRGADHENPVNNVSTIEALRYGPGGISVGKAVSADAGQHTILHVEIVHEGFLRHIAALVRKPLHLLPWRSISYKWGRMIKYGEEWAG